MRNGILWGLLAWRITSWRKRFMLPVWGTQIAARLLWGKLRRKADD